MGVGYSQSEFIRMAVCKFQSRGRFLGVGYAKIEYWLVEVV